MDLRIHTPPGPHLCPGFSLQPSQAGALFFHDEEPEFATRFSVPCSAAHTASCRVWIQAIFPKGMHTLTLKNFCHISFKYNPDLNIFLFLGK